jgi:hypothetical protein
VINTRRTITSAMTTQKRATFRSQPIPSPGRIKLPRHVAQDIRVPRPYPHPSAGVPGHQMSQDIVHATTAEVAHVESRPLHRRRGHLGTPQSNSARPRPWHFKALGLRAHQATEAFGCGDVIETRLRPRRTACVRSRQASANGPAQSQPACATDSAPLSSPAGRGRLDWPEWIVLGLSTLRHIAAGTPP